MVHLTMPWLYHHPCGDVLIICGPRMSELFLSRSSISARPGSEDRSDGHLPRMKLCGEQQCTAAYFHVARRVKAPLSEERFDAQFPK